MYWSKTSMIYSLVHCLFFYKSRRCAWVFCCLYKLCIYFKPSYRAHGTQKYYSQMENILKILSGEVVKCTMLTTSSLECVYCVLLEVVLFPMCFRKYLVCMAINSIALKLYYMTCTFLGLENIALMWTDPKLRINLNCLKYSTLFVFE